MANPSIYAAFERMWFHITAALGNKASKDIVSELNDGLMSKEDKIKLIKISDDMQTQLNNKTTVTLKTWTVTDIGGI